METMVTLCMQDPTPFVTAIGGATQWRGSVGYLHLLYTTIGPQLAGLSDTLSAGMTREGELLVVGVAAVPCTIR